jgi:endonuclease YncB( thermonuclease family)
VGTLGTRAVRLSIVLVFAIAACGGSPPAPIPTANPATSIPFQPTGPTEVATVLSITDGDTIRVDRGHGSEPVRYIGIDAPEPKEPGGSEATARNAALVTVGDEVVLETDVSDTDRFDRLLRYVWLHEGSTWTLVNLQLVKDGVAEAVAYPPDVRYQQTFVSAQAIAKNQEIGVWGLLGGPAATPKPTRKPGGGGGSNCHPSYKPCLPMTGDLNCPDVRALGLAPVRVVGPDDYYLDSDNDGLGCE